MRAEKERSDRVVDASVTQDMALAAAAQYARDVLGLVGLTWCFDGDDSNGWGICYHLAARLESGEWLSLFVGRDDGLVHGAQIDARALLAP